MKYLADMKVATMKEDCDHDQFDNKRRIPVGTIGTLHSVNHTDDDEGAAWDIIWDMGRLDSEGDPEFAWTIWYEHELDESAQVVD